MKSVNETMRKVIKNLHNVIELNTKDLAERMGDDKMAVNFMCSAMLVAVCNGMVQLEGRPAQEAQVLHGRIMAVLNDWVEAGKPPLIKPEFEAEVAAVAPESTIAVVERPKLFIPE